MTLRNRIEKNINNLKHNIDNIKNKILSPVKGIRTLHEKIKQVNVHDMEHELKQNPYQVFLNWLLEVAVTGFIATVIYVLIFKRITIIRMLELTLMFGLLRWMLLDTLKEIKNAIK